MASDFERLKEVARLVAKYWPARQNSIRLDAPDDLYSRFAAALLDPQITHPLQIPDFAENKSESYISSVQSQTKDRLYDLVFSLKLTDGSQFRNDTFSVYRDRFLADALAILGVRESATKVATQGLKAAERLGMTAAALDFLRLLRLDALFRNDRIAHEEYVERTRETLDLLNAEAEAQLAAEEALTLLRLSERPGAEALAAASSTVRRLKHLFAKNRSLTLGLQYFRVATVHAELGLNFKHCYELCSEAIQFLESLEFPISPSYFGEYALRRCEASLHLGDLRFATESLTSALKIYPPTDSNWFICMQYKYLYEMHVGEFEQALKTVEVVKTNSRYLLLPSDRTGRWRLFSLYAEIFLGRARTPQVNAALVHELETAREELSAWKEDKSGLNLFMMIAELLLMLDRGDITALGAQTDRVRVYKNRYLTAGSEAKAIADLLVHLCKHLSIPSDLTPSGHFMPTTDICVVPLGVLRTHIDSSLRSLLIATAAPSRKTRSN